MKLPLVELHLHIEGTLEPELLFELAARNAVTLPWASLAELRAQYDFTDLQSFLNLYYRALDVLRERVDFTDLTRAYLARARAAGVRHAEIFFDPQAHTSRGVPLKTALAGVRDALDTSVEHWGISTKLIVTFLRDRPATEALHILREILADGVPIDGIGLDSAEVGYPPELFTEVFALARAHGLRLVAHAGEEGPPDYVWQALDLLGVERIDHGIRSLEDEVLLDRLVRDRIPLTVCPFSNVRLRVIDTLADHPIVRMLDRGLLACVNSDDPAYFGGYIDDNLAALDAEFSLGPDRLALLARNGIEASFLTDAEKASLAAEVDAWLSAQPAAAGPATPPATAIRSS
ncbi:adenosine deaminase [Cryobacterium sinapicolor]|uniref:Adenine deaminase n=1 Tax=Cryobacterium sinapicolor TaxID=1259236 RepID=A0ABY2JD86_9MICO|nr:MULTISPECIES: adenosine deaminase [Cryobacterium]TFC86395.1 adenosine deaminase [Cryobacterium sp. TMT3-29-2]TFD03106.1 adenosine deaminase [Cryobacterium sinapicolor]